MEEADDGGIETVGERVTSMFVRIYRAAWKEGRDRKS